MDYGMDKLKLLIRYMNLELFGSNYTRIYGHSYFSYVVGVERQQRNVLHYHMIVDRPINYELVHKTWGMMCGFAWIKPIIEASGAINYISKYVIKGGELLPYFIDEKVRLMAPKRKPLWYTLCVE
jgi:hypothetical protein